MREISDEVMIERLEQIVSEDSQARRNIRAKVIADLLKSGKQAAATIALAVQKINEFFKESHPEEQQKRIDLIKHKSSEAIVMEILIDTITLLKPASIQEIAHKLAVHLDMDNFLDGVQTAAELLSVTSKAYLLFIHPKGTHMGSPTITPRFRAGSETFNFIEKTRFLDPMTCKPNPWTTNRNGGYLSVRHSALLGSKTHHEYPQNLDTLNTLQSIEWELDAEVLKEPETPPSSMKTKAQVIEQIRMQLVSSEVYKLFQERKFYFMWQYDTRGRAYMHGYYINLQSYSYKKALLNLAKKEIINGY